MYKTVILPYSVKAKVLAAMIEEKANEMEKAGYTLVSVTTTPFPKSILVFKKNL